MTFKSLETNLCRGVIFNMKRYCLPTLLFFLVTLLFPVYTYAASISLPILQGVNIVSPKLTVVNYGVGRTLGTQDILPYVYSTAAVPVVTAPPIGQSKVDLSKYTKVLYVSTSGNDASGTGAISSPFKTVQKAVQTASNGYAVFVQEGSYDVTNGDLEYEGDMSGLNNLGKNIDFVGVPGKTILQIKGETVNNRDVHAYSGLGFSNIYNMIFEYNAGDRSSSYANALFGYNRVYGNIYNSVFVILGKYQPTLTYGNNYNTVVDCFNCVISTPFNFASSYTGESSSLIFTDTVITKQFAPGPSLKTNVLQNATVDSTFHLLNSTRADVGVYSGAYSW
jgi:hypothetical protein